MKYRENIGLVIVFLLIGCTSSNQEAISLLKSGNEKLSAGEIQKAEQYYREALEVRPGFPDALNNLGIIRLQQGRYSESLEFFDESIIENSRFKDAYLNRSTALYEVKLYESALRDLYFVESLDDSVQLGFRKGLIFTQMNEYDSAYFHFTVAIQSDSSNIELFTNRGTVSYYKGDINEALGDLRWAVRLDSQFAPAFNAMALVFVKRDGSPDDLDSAEIYIKEALELVPNDSYYLNNYGFVLLKKGLLDEASEKIDQSIIMDPTNGWAYRNKGLLYLERNEVKRALQLFNQAAEMAPNVEGLYRPWANALYRDGQLGEACKKLAEAINRNENVESIEWGVECANQ